MAVKRTYYKDRYNDDKVWEVVKLKGGYYLRQYICGEQFGNGLRTTKKFIQSLGILDFETVKGIKKRRCKMNMKIELEVMEQVTLYLKENLPKYTVLKVRKKSYHPDDSHLYMVSAKKDNGTYAVWTCWNQKLKSLNHGHYNLQNEEECEKVMDEFYYNGDSLL